MIAGKTRGAGGPALARHLMSRKGGQTVEVMPVRHLMGETLREQIDDLVMTSAHGRTDRPVHHLHIDPPPDCADPEAVIATYIRHYEIEFGFENSSRCGVYHVKNGRKHAHVVWSLVREDGSVISLAHDHARREKISRIVEFEHGLPFTKGKHNRSAEQALRAEGRADVADAIEAAGLLTGRPGIAHSTPRQRAQAERTSVPVDEIRDRVLAAWKVSDDARSFAVALHAFDFFVAQGDRGLVLVDRAAGTHALTRTLAAAARATGAEKISAAAVRKRISGINFPTVKEALNARQDRRDPERRDVNESHHGEADPVARPTPEVGGRGGSSRRDQSIVVSDDRDSRASHQDTAAARKRFRERAAASALGGIDLQRINATTEAIMKSNKPQDFKEKILSENIPGGFNAHPFSLDLRMIKKPSEGNSTARIMTTDGGWIECDPSGRTVRTWGPAGRAQILAAALAAHLGVEVDHFAKTASVGASADALKVAKASEDTIKSLVKFWTVRGYSATSGPDGCWINAGRSRILDTGDQMEIHGGLSDEAIAATLVKARDAWGGGVYLDGEWTQTEQDRMWIAAQRSGIEVQNCYPSQAIQTTWQREQEQFAKTVRTFSSVRTEIIEAQHLLNAAMGDIEAAKKLPGNLQAFIGVYLDDDQRKELARQPIAEIVPHLEHFRKLGAAELQSYEAPGDQKVAFVEPGTDAPRSEFGNVHVPQ